MVWCTTMVNQWSKSFFLGFFRLTYNDRFKLLPAADQYIKCETYGIVIDLYKGYISLVVEGKEISPPAFGKGSSWAESIIEEQYTMIKNQELHIMTSMLAVRGKNLP